MYKFLRPAACLIILLSAANVKAQDNFEGKLNIKISHDGTQQNMDYFTKGENIRIEMENSGQESIILMNKKNMSIVMPAQRMYMQFPLDKINKQQIKQEADKQIPEDMKRTGEKREINGYQCEKWEYAGDDGMTEMWVTDELGSFVMGQSPMGDDDKPEWQKKLEGEGFFPMLVITKNKGGEENSRFEVTSIEKMNLNNSLFAPPTDYQKMEMPGME